MICEDQGHTLILDGPDGAGAHPIRWHCSACDFVTFQPEGVVPNPEVRHWDPDLPADSAQRLRSSGLPDEDPVRESELLEDLVRLLPAGAFGWVIRQAASTFLRQFRDAPGSVLLKWARLLVRAAPIRAKYLGALIVEESEDLEKHLDRLAGKIGAKAEAYDDAVQRELQGLESRRLRDPGPV